jgi:hypothetical protein
VQWRVPLQIALGSLRPLALSPQFLHAGADGREIIEFGSRLLLHRLGSSLVAGA